MPARRRRTPASALPPAHPLPMDDESVHLRELGAQKAEQFGPLSNEKRAEIIAILRAVQPLGRPAQ